MLDSVLLSIKTGSADNGIGSFVFAAFVAFFLLPFFVPKRSPLTLVCGYLPFLIIAVLLCVFVHGGLGGAAFIGIAVNILLRIGYHKN